MDRVRFGRALGSGLRAAASAALQAADAAASPSPASPARPMSPARPTTQAQPAAAARPATPTPRSSPEPGGRRQAAEPARRQTGGTQGPHKAAPAAGGALRTAVRPLVRASGTLWLEVTGVLFAMIALAAGSAALHDRAGLRLAADPALRTHAVVALAMFLIFAWFTVSSFLRASRRSRG